MLDFYFNEEPGPYRMQCSIIFIMVLSRKGKYSSWGFTLTHLYFSLHLFIAMPEVEAGEGPVRAFHWYLGFLQLVLSPQQLVAHIKLYQQEKISLKRLHIYRIQTPIRYSLLKWQLLSICTQSSHCPEETCPLPPRKDSEWEVPCSKCQHNWAP